MKSSKQLRPYASPRETETAPTTALTVRACEIIFPQGVETLGEKANFLHSYSVEASKRSTGAAILAGWVLSVARSTCAYGQWNAWLEKNVSFGARTATNYLSLYAQTLGAQRAAMRRPIALDVQPTEKELEEAAVEVDGKSLSALYKSTKLIKPTEGHGGARPGAGRKAKDDAEAAKAEAAELDAVVEPALLYASAKGPLDELWRLVRERDLFERLGDEEFAQVIGTLQAILNFANAAAHKRANGGR